MKQNISPVTAAILTIVFVAVIALVGYKFLGASSKGANSAQQQETMKKAVQTYGANQREEAEKHRNPMGGMGAYPGGGVPTNR